MEMDTVQVIGWSESQFIQLSSWLLLSSFRPTQDSGQSYFLLPLSSYLLDFMLHTCGYPTMFWVIMWKVQHTLLGLQSKLTLSYCFVFVGCFLLMVLLSLWISERDLMRAKWEKSFIKNKSITDFITIKSVSLLQVD